MNNGDWALSEQTPKEWWWKAKPVVNPIIVPEPIRLLSVDGWFLEKTTDSADFSNVYHYCKFAYWKALNHYYSVKNGYCSYCCEEMPKEIIAAYTLHNWQHINSGRNEEPELFQTPIEVFR